MHELSIAMSIVKIAEKETAKANAGSVTKVELEIGALSGVEPDSLNFVWESAIKNSVLERAEIEIEIVSGKGKCLDCDTEFEMEFIYDACPNCDSNAKDILHGKELKIKSLVVS